MSVQMAPVPSLSSPHFNRESRSVLPCLSVQIAPPRAFWKQPSVPYMDIRSTHGWPTRRNSLIRIMLPSAMWNSALWLEKRLS